MCKQVAHLAGTLRSKRTYLSLAMYARVELKHRREECSKYLADVLLRLVAK